jgi:hypothetical protein
MQGHIPYVSKQRASLRTLLVRKDGKYLDLVLMLKLRAILLEPHERYSLVGMIDPPTYAASPQFAQPGIS